MIASGVGTWEQRRDVRLQALAVRLKAQAIRQECRRTRLGSRTTVDLVAWESELRRGVIVDS